MLSKTEKKLEKARADLKACRVSSRRWRKIAETERNRARAFEAGLTVLADTNQAWTQGAGQMVASNVSRIARLALKSGLWNSP